MINGSGRLTVRLSPGRRAGGPVAGGPEELK
jgi:hypothetical protein